MFYRHPLWNRLDKEILPFVIKPGRYIGNELNSIHKPHDAGLLKIALCFPEMYEIGMSYVGMQILYNIINRRPDCLAERAFSVWHDMQESLLRKGLPLFALESATPLSEFDVLGFHLTYEMTYATSLNMLHLAGIPQLAVRRDDSHPLILAGGPSVLNPEPMADFMDAFFIGDAEEGIHEIIGVVKEGKSKGMSRESVLLDLSQIDGIYVPRLYKPVYDAGGRFKALEKLNPNAPDKIKVRSVPELKSEYYPSKPILPYIETTHDHLAVEIMRGCVRGCRFCQAGYQYRPRRQRSPDEIAAQVASGLAATGYEGVTLLSLSSTDYDHLGELLAKIGPRLTEQRVTLGLPSLRPETIAASVLEAISSARKTGLTLAPEAGTERLRNIAGKKISDEDIYAAFATALSCGWQTFKLYFMIGLPGETDDDIEGIISILRRLSHMIKEQGGRNINVALSPFSPKTNTPWQWERQASKDELQRKIDKITSRTKKSNLNLKYRNLDLAFMECVLGRGDRGLGQVILKAWQKGTRLDGWSEFFDANRWYEAFAECAIDPASFANAIDENSPLPWDHVDKGISKEYLKKDNRKSREGIPPPSAFDWASPANDKRQAEAGFGRKPKRMVRPTSPPGTYKLRVRYSRAAECRYLSHLDMIRALYKAFRRAELPVAFSEGYHPHIKVSFGQPLPLGYTSDAEYFDLQLTQPFREEYMIRQSQAMPPGLSILGYKPFFASTSSLSKQLNLARYIIPNIESVSFDRDKLLDISLQKSLNVKRVRNGSETEVDAGQFIQDITVDDCGMIADVWQMPEGHIKPEEILTFGLGIDTSLVKATIIHRKEQFHKSGMRLVDPLDLV